VKNSPGFDSRGLAADPTKKPFIFKNSVVEEFYSKTVLKYFYLRIISGNWK